MSDLYRITEQPHHRAIPKVRYGSRRMALAVARATGQYNRSLAEGEEWMRQHRPDVVHHVEPTKLTIERLVVTDEEDVTSEFTDS